MTSRLICFGEMLVRLTAPQGETLLQTPSLAAHIGGAEANVASCVARLGGSAAMATVLPDNPLGWAARDELRRRGVDTSLLHFAPGRMGLYFLTPGAVLRPSEIIYDRQHSVFAERAHEAFDWTAALEGAEWLHISGITPAVSEQGAQAALAAAQAASSLNVRVSFDGNYRSKLWEARGRKGDDILRQLLALSSLAFIDERDISLVLGQTFENRGEAVGAAFKAFPQLQMIAATMRATTGATDHTLGAELFTRTQYNLIEPVRLPGVIDRVGGGDAFAGGLLHALLSDMPDTDALRFALYASIVKHGQTGDSLNATEADILDLMNSASADIRR